MCNIVKTYIYEQLKKLTTIAWKWLMKVDEGRRCIIICNNNEEINIVLFFYYIMIIQALVNMFWKKIGGTRSKRYVERNYATWLKTVV